MNNQNLIQAKSLRGLYLLSLIDGLAYMIFIWVTMGQFNIHIILLNLPSFIPSIATFIVGLIGLIAYTKPNQVKKSLVCGLFCGLITAAIASSIIFCLLLYFILFSGFFYSGIYNLEFAWSLINLLLMIATAVFQKKHTSLLQQEIVQQMNNYPVNDGEQPYNRYD